MSDPAEALLFLRPETVLEAYQASNKKQLLENLASFAAEQLSDPNQPNGVDKWEIFEKLLQREALGSTAMGDGVAVPHAKIKHIETIFGMFARLEHEIDFDAPDSNKVKLVFLLLAPDHASADHLKALARVSRLLRDEVVREKLLGANDRDALFAILTESPAPRNGNNGNST